MTGPAAAASPPDIRLVAGLPEGVLDAVAAVGTLAGGFDAAYVREHVAQRRNVLTCLAYVGGELAGYKIGFEERRHYFESWQGAVAPAFRRRGIARALLDAQHQWCREQGYRYVTTITEGNNHAMLIANLQVGFDVCGTFLDRGKVLKVVLQKALS